MTLFEQVQELLYIYVFPSGDTLSNVAVDLISTCATLFLIAVPFIFVYRIIKLLGGR